MSWLIQNLLRNSLKIKTESHLDSDEYNDLLVVEGKIKSLVGQKIITDDELVLIDKVSSGATFATIANELSVDRDTIFSRFSALCTKIAFYAGSYFTDDGYIFYMKRKHNLSDAQVFKLRQYMTGRYKNKLIRITKENE